MTSKADRSTTEENITSPLGDPLGGGKPSNKEARGGEHSQGRGETLQLRFAAKTTIAVSQMRDHAFIIRPANGSLNPEKVGEAKIFIYKTEPMAIFQEYKKVSEAGLRAGKGERATPLTRRKTSRTSPTNRTGSVIKA